MSKYSNLQGSVIGSWTLIKRDRKDKNGHFLWECKCICGKIKYIYQTHLVRGAANSCGCQSPKGPKHVQWKGIGEISADMWHAIFRNANGEKTKRKSRRYLDFTITLQYVWDLFLKQNRKCALTGIPLTFTPKTASLDRISSSKGYTPENVQWVHKDVNRMKNVYEQEYFISMCQMVSEYSKGLR